MEQKEQVFFKGKNGFHARPAGIFSRKAKSYASSVKLVKTGEALKEADGKKLLELMKLDIRHQDELLLIVRGEDALEAGAALKKLLEEVE